MNVAVAESRRKLLEVLEWEPGRGQVLVTGRLASSTRSPGRGKYQSLECWHPRLGAMGEVRGGNQATEP